MKILGYALLVCGLAVIFYSLFTSYNIFTNKTPAPTIFKIENQEKTTQEKEAILPQKEKTQDFKSEIDRLLEEKLQEQLAGIMPADYLPKLLNLIAWSIFTGILIFGGAQISGIGIKLLTARK